MANLKPPFRAENMEGLYNKVNKGVYQKLAGHFSADLNEFISHMLKVNPKSRYSAAELLCLPTVIERTNNFASFKEIAEEGRPSLLQTITMPSNLQLLNEKLPKPNYEPLKLVPISNAEVFGKPNSSKATNELSLAREIGVLPTRVLLKKTLP